MEWIWDIAILVGIATTFGFQRHQISTLRTEVSSQDRIIKGMKTFVEMFESDAVREWVKMKIETEAHKKEKEFAKVKEELEAQLEKS